ncbi:MAG: phosphoenolpyruvate--protein phosphotransferase [Steroidobacteraceae bacterium]
MTDLVLLSPLPGWCAPLDEVPDEVFAGRMMGDGLAIDPTAATLLTPCDGELTTLPGTAHAVTIRSPAGAEILLHIGIDTVALNGVGFEALVRPGQAVRAGDPLIRFDLDQLARRAKSLITPVIVTEPERFRIVARHATGRLLAGDPLMTLREVSAPAASAADGKGGTAVTETLVVPLPHGLHARPAAMLAQSLRSLSAEVSLSLRDRTVNARSAVALMSLGARRGDRLTLRATGADAAMAPEALEQAFARAMAQAGVAQSTEPAAVRPTVTEQSGLGGVAAAGGVAVGQSIRIARTEPAVPEHGDGAHRELQRLNDARKSLRRRLARLGSADDSARADIVAAHLEFLDDPELLATAHAEIAAGKSAGFAWRAAVGAAIRALESLEDSHLAARADDLRDLELQLLELLAGAAKPAAAALPERAILIARDLLPSQLLALEAARVAGICTVSRAATSHVAILAAAMGVPMLTGVDATVMAIADGTTILLDADRGSLTIMPGAAEIAEAEARIAERARVQARLRTAAALDCRTADGERVEVFANVGSVAEAAAAVSSGAEGCGLLRTEFLFLDRATPPDVEEQTRQYQEVVTAFGRRPVVVRTLDAGSDKPIPFLAMPPQDNPALGLRGIRVSLWRPELLRVQIAAILAVRPVDRCRILLPMVNDIAEIQAVRRIIDELAGSSRGNARIPLGIMIETPASALNAANLARHADFFSIGTNDLTQYVLAIDRAHPTLAAGLDALHPAVLRLIGDVCSAARAANRSVAVCGGLASDPAAAPILVGLGVGELSAVPAVIPAIKDAVRRRTSAQCHALARDALDQDSAQAVRELLASTNG